MSLFHTIEDGAFNEILHDLRLIKAVGGTLISASVSGDALEEEEIGSLACLVHEKAKNIMQTLEDLESKGVDTPPPSTSTTETDPFERGKAVIAYFKSTYDLLNSAIARNPRIKEQLKGLQGEAADLMAKFDDLLIDLDYIPGEAPSPAA